MAAFSEQTRQQVKSGYLMLCYSDKTAKDTCSIINLAEANLLYPRSYKKGQRQLTTEQIMCTHAKTRQWSNGQCETEICAVCGVHLHVTGAPIITPTMPWNGEAGKLELRALLTARPLPFHQITARPKPWLIVQPLAGQPLAAS